MSIGNISKLLEERVATFTQQTNDIVNVFADRLTPAFQKVFNAPGRNIIWSSVDFLTGSTKAVMVSGYMALELGEKINIGDKEIVVDETNINEYNKFVKFAFPIIMLELATVDELVEHINRIAKIGSTVEMTPEALVKVLDKVADEYQERILNDPMKITVIDNATKPEAVLGFSAAELTEDQIRTLKMYENIKLGMLH